MAGNKITREDILDEKVLSLGADYKKSIEEAIKANIEWENSFHAIKKSITDLNDLEKEFKSASTTKQFISAKEKEVKIDSEANALLKEQERLLKALNTAKAKQATASSQVNQELQKTRYETNQLNKAERDRATLSSKLSSEYQKQEVRLRQLRDAYKNLATRQELHGDLSRKQIREMNQLQKEAQKLDASLKRVDASVGQMQRNVGNYSSAFQGMTANLKSFVGAFGLVSGIYLFANAIRDAFRRVREFDSSMQSLSGIMRVTRKDLKDLERSIIAIAGRSVRSSNEVAELAQNLATLGKTKDEIKDLLEPVINLSIGLETAADEAGEFLIQMLNTFGASTESASEYADVIGSIRASTTLDFQKMRDSFAYLAPIARILNKDLAWTGSVVGILADNGIKAESAGRLLSTSMIKMATNGVELGDALMEINRAMRDGKTEPELLTIASRNFDSQATKIAVTLARNIDGIEELAESIRNSGGALDHLVGEQLESLDAKLKIMESSYEQFVLSIENGNGILSKSFKGVVEGITWVFNVMTELNKTAEDLGGEVAERRLSNQAKRYRELGQEAMAYAKIDEENAKRRLEALQAQKKALEEQAEQAKNSTGGWQLFFDVITLGATSRMPKFRDEVDRITVSIASQEAILKSAQMQLGTYVKTIDELAQEERESIKTVAQLKEEIAGLQRQLEQANIADVEGIRVIQDKIKTKQKELDAILGVTRGTKKATKEQKDWNAELIKFQEITKVDFLKGIYSDSTVDIQLRQTALKNAVETELNLIDFIRDERLKNVKKGSDEELFVIAEAEKKKRDIIKDSEAITDEMIISDLKQRAQTQANIQARLLEEELSRENEIFESTKNQYKNLEEATKAHEERVADIKKRYAIDALNAQIDAIEELLKTEILSADERIELEAQIARSKREISDLEKVLYKKDGAERVMTEKEIAREIIRVSEGIASAITDIFHNIAQGRIDDYQREIDESNARYERLLEDDTLYEEDRKRIEETRLAAQMEIEKKIAKEKRRQAIFDKALAAIQIGVNTAEGITRVMPNPVLIALVSALGAAQAAAVLSMKIPAYEKGTDYHPGGLALVGEKRAEVIEEPGKAPYIVKKPTILNLAEGTKVTPSIEEYERLMRASILASVDINNQRMSAFQSRKTFDNNNDIVKKLDELKKTVSRSKTTVNFQGRKAPDINFQLWRNNQIDWR